MNKKVIMYSILGILFFVSCKPAVEGEYDSRAVDSLDKLSELYFESIPKLMNE